MRIALVGYGKMGQRIEELALAQGHNIVHRYDQHNAHRLHEISDTDVAIEFTSPEAAVGNLKILFEKNIPVVCGTTGWYAQFNEVTQAAEFNGARLMYATNFSIGVQLALAANDYLASLLDKHRQYSAHIDEWHHTAKKDAPSGTAITFAERLINQHRGYNTWKLDGGDEAQELPIRAYREDDIPGTHIVRYESEIDQISLSHKAYSRDGFAQGAIDAAHWLTGQKPGVYTMKDFLQL